MKLNKQKGFSLINLILAIVFIGFFGIVGFQIGMGYLDQSAIRAAVKQSLIHAQNNENTREKDIADDIIKQVGLNSIDLKQDNIYVTKNDKQSFTVEVEYNKEINITKKIKIVMDLDVAEETK